MFFIKKSVTKRTVDLCRTCVKKKNLCRTYYKFLQEKLCIEQSIKKRWRRIEGKLGQNQMGIRFVLMVNKQGQTRLAQYYEYLTIEERRVLEAEIVRKCLARNEKQVPFSSFHSLSLSLSLLFVIKSPFNFVIDCNWFRFSQCSFVEHRNYKIVYRRYASLFFLVGVDDDEVNHFPCCSALNWFIETNGFFFLVVKQMDYLKQSKSCKFIFILI